MPWHTKKVEGRKTFVSLEPGRVGTPIFLVSAEPGWESLLAPHGPGPMIGSGLPIIVWLHPGSLVELYPGNQTPPSNTSHEKLVRAGQRAKLAR